MYSMYSVYQYVQLPSDDVIYITIKPHLALTS